MKILKKILSITIMTILISTSFSYGNSDKKYINEMIDIKSKTITENSEFFKADIKYPYLEIKDKNINKNDTTYEIIKNINKEMYDYIIGFKDKIKEESSKYEKDYKEIYSKEKYNSVKYQYEAYSEYDVTYNKNNILSIPITNYEFTGGAHGMTYLKSYNYNLLTGKEIKLKDIFSKNDYENIINNYISKEIEKNKGLYFIGENGFKGINSNQEFYIEEDGLVVYFQLYDIAPYYVGIPKFKIPWSQFKSNNIGIK